MSGTKKSVILFAVIVLLVAGAFVLQRSYIGEQREVTIIRVGVLPDQDQATLIHRYSPLLEHLARETGLKYQLVVPASYDDLLHMFADKKIEIAFFGGLTFVKAHTFYGAQALVMRDVDTRFTSYFVVRGDGPFRDCEGFKCKPLAGKVLSFGSKLSTSGHLMPRYFLKSEKRMEPETYFGEVRYSGAHDKTMYQTRDGEVDVGAVNAEIFRAMHRDGRLGQDDLRIIWETPPYPNYVWAIDSTLTEELRTKVRDAFLKLEAGNKEYGRILSLMGANSFLPAGAAEFTPLREIAKSLDMLKLEK